MPTNYSGNGSKPTLPLALPNDGEDVTFATFIQANIEKLMDWLSYLDAGGGQIPNYSGNSFTIGDGNPSHSSALTTFLDLLADKAAKLDAGNLFTGNNVYQGNNTFQKALYIAAQGYFARPASAVATNATTLTMDVTAHSMYTAESWNGSGGTLTVTLAPYSGGDNAEMAIKFEPTAPSARLLWSKGVLTGIGSVAFRYSTSAGAWELASATGSVNITGF